MGNRLKDSHESERKEGKRRKSVNCSSHHVFRGACSHVRRLGNRRLVSSVGWALGFAAPSLGSIPFHSSQLSVASVLHLQIVRCSIVLG